MIGSRLGLGVITSMLCLGSGLAGCQVVAGIEDRPEDPILDGCRLPAGTEGGGASIRFANFVPVDGAVDVCVRAAGGSYGRPVLRGGGSACPAGFTYSQVSAPFSAPAGQIDVKAIAGGSTCSGETIAEALAVPTPSGSTTTIALMGHPASGRQLRAYPDATQLGTAGSSKFRIVHAIPNGPKLSFGFADGSHLPTALGIKLLIDPLAYGDSTKPDSKVTVGRADPDGYLELPGTQLNIGAAPVDTTRALMVTGIPLEQIGRTYWAVGDPNNNAYPVRALFCREMAPSVTVSNVPLADCQPSALATISVDAVNVSLTGGRTIDEDARRPFVINAIGARDSDLMCVTGVGRRSDRDAILQKAKESGAFPFSVSADTDLDTPPTDARDQNGNVPPKPTIPPCGGTVEPSMVDAAIQCVTDNCSTTGTPAGLPIPASLNKQGGIEGGVACLSTKCAPLFIGLLGGDSDHQRCYGCLGFSASSYETHAQTKTQCTTDIRDYRLFRGETPSVILSKFPIKSQETFLLPATFNQRAVHRAEVEIESGVTVDFYCAEISPAYGTLLPNYSAYSNGATAGDDWYEEQKLQARRAIDFIKAKSTGRPTIIAGDWATSKADPANGISEQNPAFVDMLEKEFAPAVPLKGFVPHCTACAKPENPFNTEQSIWNLKTYLFNMPKGVDTAAVFWTESPVPLPNGTMGPLAHRFGYNARVIRP